MLKLIEEIKKLQKLKGLNDKEFSLAIGIDAGHWSKIKRGLSTPGARFINGIARTYPELELAIHDYIMTGGTKAAV
jgi:transcriptional regulator with XRE-family HTH domain